MKQPSMMGYIKDQPRALKTSFSQRTIFCTPMVEIFQQHCIKKVYLIGSGTSYHASLAIRHYFEQYLEVEVTVCIPTVFTNYEQINRNKKYSKEEVLVIAISQSGTSLSTIHAVQRARSEGYTTVVLTENLESIITQESKYVIPLTCGKECIPIETRGYSVTVLTGLCWAIELARSLRKISSTTYQEKIMQIEEAIQMLPQVLVASEEWYEKNKVDLLNLKKGAIAGYGMNYVTALEATLKLYETFHQPISGFELEEMIHGFEMAFDKSQYIFIIASKDKELNRIPLFRDFLQDLTSHIYILTYEDIEVENQDFKYPIHCMKEMSPIFYILPFQIMAARNCENIGYDTAKYPHARRSFSHKRDETK